MKQLYISQAIKKKPLWSRFKSQLTQPYDKIKYILISTKKIDYNINLLSKDDISQLRRVFKTFVDNPVFVISNGLIYTNCIPKCLL